MMGEIMAVGRKQIALGAERRAVLVVAALEAGEGQFVVLGVANTDGTQGMQVGVNVAEDVIEAFPGIAYELTDLEGGEAGTQVGEAWEGEGVVIVVGGGKGAGDGPESEEAIVNDVEGLGLIAEVVLALGSGSLFWVLAGIGAVVGLV
jgi:hypothetical protein